MDCRLTHHPLGFWTLKNPPSPQQLTTHYRDRYFQEEHGNYRREYSAAERQWFAIQTDRVVAAASLAAGSQLRRALDVGCGEGFALAWLHAHGYEAMGIDHSVDGIRRFHPNLLEYFRSVDITESLATVISGDTYDLIMLRNVLEHVLDPVALLRELRSVVTPGGALVVTVPNDGSEWHEYLLEAGSITDRFWIAVPDHISYFNADSLRRVAECAGWTCSRLLAEFPIDWFLANPTANYVIDKTLGAGAHAARLAVDAVLSRRPMNDVLRYLEAMAAVGMGRQISAVLVPPC